MIFLHLVDDAECCREADTLPIRVLIIVSGGISIVHSRLDALTDFFDYCVHISIVYL